MPPSRSGVAPAPVANTGPRSRNEQGSGEVSATTLILKESTNDNHVLAVGAYTPQEAPAGRLEFRANTPVGRERNLQDLAALLVHEKRFEEALQLLRTLPARPGPPNLLLNGSFEFGLSPAADRLSLLPGAQDILGWTIVGPPGLDLQWLGPLNHSWLSAADGGSFLDLTGLHDAAPYPGVSQSIATVIGESYRVSFAIGSEAMYDRSTRPSVAVEVTGQPPRTCTVSAVGTNRWQTFEFTFTASQTNTTLTFTGANPGTSAISAWTTRS